MGPFWKNWVDSARKEKITDTKDVKGCCKERRNCSLCPLWFGQRLMSYCLTWRNGDVR